MRHERNVNVDFMRGFVMLLLPLFHSTTGMIHTIIGVYQMPLLMMISGYLTFNENRQLDIKWVYKRGKRLLLPFLFWSCIYWLPKWKQYQFKGLVDAMFSTVYWFLIVLFIFSILIWLSDKTSKFLRGGGQLFLQ